MQEEAARKVRIEKKLKITKKLIGIKRVYGGSCARANDGSTCSVRGSIHQ